MRRIVLSALMALVFGCSSHAASTIVPTQSTQAGATVSPSSISFVRYAVGPVFRMALGHDGNVWFIGDPFTDPTAFGRITPTGDVATGTLPANVSAITANPDGNIYIAARNAVDCHIYQVHPDMTFEDFPYTCQNGSATAVVSGYDQRIWIIDGSTILTRITTSGSVSTLQMPGVLIPPIIRGNATGRAMIVQGNSDTNGDMVYRIAPDDSITASAQVRLKAAVVTKDGEIWGFQYLLKHQVPTMVRMDDDLTFTLIPLHNGIQEPNSIVAHLGTLLMPAPTLGVIYRFSSDRERLETRWSDPAQVETAILGPSNTLWLSDDSIYVYVGTLN